VGVEGMGWRRSKGERRGLGFGRGRG